MIAHIDADSGALIVLQAPAKLTLSLRVTGIRADGMHLIEAEMVTLDLADTLYLVDAAPLAVPPDPAVSPDPLGGTGGVGERLGDRPRLTVVDEEGQPIEGIPAGPENLVNRAMALVGQTARITLVKRIPAQAGLGGGSSDAGAILRWAGFDDLDAAAALGADVPFCSVGGRARVAGIGEIVEPLTPVAEVYTLLTPPLGCPTGPVYRRWDELGGPEGLNDNDLEPAALDVVPELARWRDELGEASGLTPRLAGSGSTWFVAGSFPGPGRVVTRTVSD